MTASSLARTVPGSGPVSSRHPRPPRPTASTASLVFLWRGMVKVKHVPEQLFDVIMIPLLFTLMFTYLFGGALAGSPSAYLRDLLPGTLVLSVLLVSVYTGVGLNADVATGVFDRFRSLPIWRPAPIVGALLGDVGRNTLAASLVIGLGLLMGFRPEGGLIGTVLAVALLLVFAFGLGWIWSTLGLVLRSSSSVNTVSLVVVFPLSFTSNIFVEPSTMPTWLEWFVAVNPVSSLVTAVRGLVHGPAFGQHVAWVLIVAAALVTTFAPLTMRLYRNKL